MGSYLIGYGGPSYLVTWLSGIPMPRYSNTPERHRGDLYSEVVLYVAAILFDSFKSVFTQYEACKHVIRRKSESHLAIDHLMEKPVMSCFPK